MRCTHPKTLKHIVFHQNWTQTTYARTHITYASSNIILQLTSFDLKQVNLVVDAITYGCFFSFSKGKCKVKKYFLFHCEILCTTSCFFGGAGRRMGFQPVTLLTIETRQEIYSRVRRLLQIINTYTKLYMRGTGETQNHV